jgi:aryl-alcohol dehydrogenase-like predicted oxidoreductase
MSSAPQLSYRLFGRSGLRVSEICLGGMTFGTEWGWGAEEREVRAQLEVFAEAGGNFVDTSDFYTGGSSERLLGLAIAGDRDRWVVGTKYSLHRRPNDPNAQGNHRKNLTRAVEGSLRRLKSDYIDVLWVHAWDFTMRPDDVLWALERLAATGKVLHLGISDTPAWIVSSSQAIADLRGWPGFAGVQLEYSLTERTAEGDLLPMAGALGLGVTAWAPLGGGTLTGKYLSGTPEQSRLAAGYPLRTDDRAREIAATVARLAAQVGRPPAQVALAWLLARTAPAVIPIVGARSAAQLSANLGACGVRLPEDMLKELEEATRVALGFPHDFLRSEMARYALWGNSRERVL